MNIEEFLGRQCLYDQTSMHYHELQISCKHYYFAILSYFFFHFAKLILYFDFIFLGSLCDFYSTLLSLLLLLVLYLHYFKNKLMDLFKFFFR